MKLICLLATQHVSADQKDSLSGLTPSSLFSGTELCICHFKVILKWVAYTITLEALTVVLFKPDKEFQVNGLRREPSKVSSTNSAMTE